MRAWTLVEVCSDNGGVSLGSTESELRQDGPKICPDGAQISPLARTLKGWTHSHALVESQNILDFAALDSQNESGRNAKENAFREMSWPLEVSSDLSPCAPNRRRPKFAFGDLLNRFPFLSPQMSRLEAD